MQRAVSSKDLRREIGIVLTCLVVGLLGFLTFQRNKDYHSRITMWEDVLRERPDNARAHFSLGLAYFAGGKEEEAMRYYSSAVRLKPAYTDAHIDLGLLLFKRRKMKEAVYHLEEAVSHDPDSAEARNNYSVVLVAQ